MWWTKRELIIWISGICVGIGIMSVYILLYGGR